MAGYSASAVCSATQLKAQVMVAPGQPCTSAERSAWQAATVCSADSFPSRCVLRVVSTVQ